MDKSLRTSTHAPPPAPLPERRWQGILTDAQIAWCRAHGVAIGYDPAQLGWVPLDIEEAEEELAPPLSARLRPVRGKTLRFRPWTMADIPRFAALLDDPEVWAHLYEPWPGQMTEALVRDLIAVALLEAHHEVRAVEHRGAVVGQVRLLFGGHGADRSTAEISYWLGRAYWGQGIGREVVIRATTAALAGHAGLGSLIAYVHPANLASTRVLAHAGYAADGTREDGWLRFRRNRRRQ